MDNDSINSPRNLLRLAGISVALTAVFWSVAYFVQPLFFDSENTFENIELLNQSHESTNGNDVVILESEATEP